MKTKLFMLALAAAGTILAGCEKEDDIRVDQTIKNAFRNQYPDAARVEWEKKAGYYVAEFRMNNTEAEAWYSPQAIWYMTETDVRYDDLPQAVKEAHRAGEYADNWRIEDIDQLECLDLNPVYIIEVEQGNAEYDLYYSPEGVFIKAVPDGNGSGHLPSTVLPAVKEFIAEKYPQARIVDIEQGHNRIEVDIIDGRIPREVVFSSAGEWEYTQTEVREADVPTVVLEARKASEYGSWQIDDIDHYLTPEAEFYLFELESGNREVHLKIDLDGNIL